MDSDDILYKKIDKNDKLSYRKNIKLILENNKNIVLYSIPNKADILKYLYDIHKSDLHRGICSLRIFIKAKIIYFEGSSIMAEYIVKTCSICFQKNKNTYVRDFGRIITFYPM